MSGSDENVSGGRSVNLEPYLVAHFKLATGEAFLPDSSCRPRLRAYSLYAMWEDVDEAERARRLKEAQDDIPFLEMSLFQAIEGRNLELALKILNAHVRKGTREGYQETLDLCMRAYPKLVTEWGLNDSQAAALIDVDGSTWSRIKAEDKTLGLHQDQLGRISTLSLIYDRLHLFDHEFAIRWPTLHNEGELFGGRTPIEAMTAGGFMKMREVLRYIENLEEQH